MSDQTADVAKAEKQAEVAKLEQDADQLSKILRRIDQRRQQLKLSDRALSLAAGLSASQIRTMRRQHRLGLQHGASIRTIAHLAEALRTTPAWLISGTGQEDVVAEAPQSTGSARGLRLAGAVGAGLWNEPLLKAMSTLCRCRPIRVIRRNINPRMRFAAPRRTALHAQGIF